MNQQTIIAAVAKVLEPDERIRALFLAGSFGKGTADAWSDVDLLASPTRRIMRRLQPPGAPSSKPSGRSSTISRSVPR